MEMKRSIFFSALTFGSMILSHTPFNTSLFLNQVHNKADYVSEIHVWVDLPDFDLTDSAKK